MEPHRFAEWLRKPPRFDQRGAEIGIRKAEPISLHVVDRTPLYPGGRVPRSERSKVVQEMVEGYAAYLERAVLRAPHQWFNFFDFWAQESAER